MSHIVKDIKDIKTKRNTLFYDIINIKIFDQNNIKMDEKLYTNILIYCTGFVTVKDSKYLKPLTKCNAFHRKKCSMDNKNSM